MASESKKKSNLTAAQLAWIDALAEQDAKEYLAEQKSVHDNDSGRWEFLRALGKRGGADYLSTLCDAIDAEESIPTSALRPLAAALRQLLTDDRESAKLSNFAKALAIKKTRGRPRVDDAKFWRAVHYWILRLGQEGDEDDPRLRPMSDSEAMTFIRKNGFIFSVGESARHEYREESAVRRAVREHPEAKQFVEELNCQDEESGANSGE